MEPNRTEAIEGHLDFRVSENVLNELTGIATAIGLDLLAKDTQRLKQVEEKLNSEIAACLADLLDPEAVRVMERSLRHRTATGLSEQRTNIVLVYIRMANHILCQRIKKAFGHLATEEEYKEALKSLRPEKWSERWPSVDGT